MQVTVRLFALARERIGRPDLTLELAEPATVGGLKQALTSRFPELAPLMDHLMFAVATEYADDDHPIHSGDEVAAFPPVSGGAR